MKAFPKLVVMALSAILTACANPLNQATSDRYSESCTQAERNGRLDIAEQACYRALVNVDWGNLGEVEKSQKMYNLARIKRLYPLSRKAGEGWGEGGWANPSYLKSIRFSTAPLPISGESVARGQGLYLFID
jgi:hypothetical protein